MGYKVGVVFTGVHGRLRCSLSRRQRGFESRWGHQIYFTPNLDVFDFPLTFQANNLCLRWEKGVRRRGDHFSKA